MNKRNCLSWWFPKIEAAGLPVPRTEIIKTSINLFSLLDGQPPEGFSDFIDELEAARLRLADEHGDIFFRTGQGSGKHDWDRCCYVRSGADLRHHVANLVEWSHLVDMMGLAHDVWVVREYLDVTPLYFCSGYGNMPVIREFRAFVDGGRVAYVEPYWPAKALAEGEPTSSDWADSYDGDMLLRDSESRTIFELAAAAGDACGGRWSVDLLSTGSGWFLTDMAVAEMSYGFSEERFHAETIYSKL